MGGLFRKVITGLMRRPDREAVSNLPVGIIPLGSANMFASTLHSGECDSDSSSEGQAGWAALTVALQKTRKVDVLELTTHDGNTVYALSAIGWGAPGTMAVHAEKQAWLKSHRYWYGAAMGLLTEDAESVASCKARVAYPKGTDAAPVFVSCAPNIPCRPRRRRAPPLSTPRRCTHGDGPCASGWDAAASDAFVVGERAVDDRPGWVQRDLDVTALVATKVPAIAIGCGINPDARIDDGLVTLTWLPAQEGHISRQKLFATGFRLSKVRYHIYPDSRSRAHARALPWHGIAHELTPLYTHCSCSTGQNACR